MGEPGPSGDRNLNCGPLVHSLTSRWGKQWLKAGAGLISNGNTCFMNSVLQSLTHTPSLALFCMRKDNRKTCTQEQCTFCDFCNHVTSALTNGRQVLDTGWLGRGKNEVSKFYLANKQEDAHEFLLCFLQSLRKAIWNGHPSFPQMKEEDPTIIESLFEGALHSQVECLRCKSLFKKPEYYKVLSIDIQHGNQHLEDALAQFVKPETLDTDNLYYCERCKQKVEAEKRYLLYRTADIFVIHLKRFRYCGMQNSKISGHIRFRDTLNISKYMGPADNNQESTNYTLYSVIVHSGGSSSYGHYYSYVRSPTGIWYRMNDTMVNTVAADEVFNDGAYMLFYVRDKGTCPKQQSIVPINNAAGKKCDNARLNGTSNKYGKHGPVSSPMNGAAGRYAPNGGPVNGEASQYPDFCGPVNGHAGRPTAHHSPVKGIGDRYSGCHSPAKRTANSSHTAYHYPVNGTPDRYGAYGSTVKETSARPTLNNNHVNGTGDLHGAHSSYSNTGRYSSVNGTDGGHRPSENGTTASGDCRPVASPYRPQQATPLPQQRKKVSFGLKKTKGPQNVNRGSAHTEPQKSSPPTRIVLRISKNGHGTVSCLEKGADGSESVIESRDMSDPLVPYGVDSDSGEDGCEDWEKMGAEAGASCERVHQPESENHRDDSASCNTRDIPGPQTSNVCNGKTVENSRGEGKGADGEKYQSSGFPGVNFCSDVVEEGRTLPDTQSSTSTWPPHKYCVSNVSAQRNVRAGSLDRPSGTGRSQKRSSSLEPGQKNTDQCSGSRDDWNKICSRQRTADAADISHHATDTSVHHSFNGDTDATSTNSSFAQKTMDEADWWRSQQTSECTNNAISQDKEHKKKKKKKKKKKHRKYKDRYDQQEERNHQSRRLDKEGHVYSDTEQNHADHDNRGKRPCDFKYGGEHDYPPPCAKRGRWEGMNGAAFEDSSTQDHPQENSGSARHYGREEVWSHSSSTAERSHSQGWNRHDGREWKKQGNNMWRRGDQSAWSNQRYQRSASRYQVSGRKKHKRQYPTSRESYRKNGDHSFSPRPGSSHYHRDFHGYSNFSGSHYYGPQRNYSYQRRY